MKKLQCVKDLITTVCLWKENKIQTKVSYLPNMGWLFQILLGTYWDVDIWVWSPSNQIGIRWAGMLGVQFCCCAYSGFFGALDWWGQTNIKSFFQMPFTFPLQCLAKSRFKEQLKKYICYIYKIHHECPYDNYQHCTETSLIILVWMFA